MVSMFEPRKPFPSKTGISFGNPTTRLRLPLGGVRQNLGVMSPIGDRKGTRYDRSGAPFGGLSDKIQQRSSGTSGTGRWRLKTYGLLKEPPERYEATDRWYSKSTHS